VGGKPRGRSPGRGARVRAALPFLEKGRDPTIINISSGSGLNPSVRTPAYGAAKARSSTTRARRRHARDERHPRELRRARDRSSFPAARGSGARPRRRALQRRPRVDAGEALGRPEEVASVVLFLASPLAIWVTAQVIGVNGGQGFAK
jgi:3-oxoacyl-[acyl-carrier protein] reductase